VKEFKAWRQAQRSVTVSTEVASLFTQLLSVWSRACTADTASPCRRCSPFIRWYEARKVPPSEKQWVRRLLCWTTPLLCCLLHWLFEISWHVFSSSSHCPHCVCLALKQQLSEQGRRRIEVIHKNAIGLVFVEWVLHQAATEQLKDQTVSSDVEVHGRSGGMEHRFPDVATSTFTQCVCLEAETSSL